MNQVEKAVQSLNAVEQALSHLLVSLKTGGFGEGAQTYERMADVIIAQFMWMSDNRNAAEVETYRRVIELATDIHALIEPYVATMSRLGALSDLLDPVSSPDPESLTGRILTVLAAEHHPQSITGIRKRVEASPSTVRRELHSLIEANRVEGVRTGSRTLYRIAERE